MPRLIRSKLRADRRSRQKAGAGQIATTREPMKTGAHEMRHRAAEREQLAYDTPPDALKRVPSVSGACPGLGQHPSFVADSGAVLAESNVASAASPMNFTIRPRRDSTSSLASR